MSLQLNMYPKQDFKPVHDENYVMFVVSDFYGRLEFKYYRCEVYYCMMDAEDNGSPLPSSTSYNNQDELPFDVPLLWNKELQKYEVLTPEQVEARKVHPKKNQRFWMEKTWFLSGQGSMDQIQPHEFDELSLGIALEADFMKSIREANKIRVEKKEENRDI